VSFIEPVRLAEEKKPAEKMKITIIKQDPSMNDRACWAYK